MINDPYLDHYFLQEVLQPVGNIGLVYRAVDTILDRDVALKVVQERLAQQVEFSSRFMQAVRQLAQLDHPNIINVYGSKAEPLYLVMSFIPRGDLCSYLAERRASQNPVNLAEVVNIVLQLADALAYAQARGIIHADIKPENILLKANSEAEGIRVVLTDFGLTRLLQEIPSQEPIAPNNSLAYISPEHCLGQTIDGRSDIYSLGIIFYQLLTDKLPFTISSLNQALEKHPLERVPSLRQFVSDLPREIEAIVTRMLQKEAEARYQNAAELVQVLRAAYPDLSTQSHLGSAPETQPGSWQPLLDERYEELDSDLAMPKESTEDHLSYSRTPPTHYELMHKDRVVIGRSEDCDLIINAPSISARHARLQKLPVGWQIENLESGTGVFLNEKPVLPGVPELWYRHQTLRLGNIFLSLHLREDEASIGEKPFDLLLTPDTTPLLPGEQATATVIVYNRLSERDYYQIEVKSVREEAGDWFILPQAAFPLEAGQQSPLPLEIRPFLYSQPGEYSYWLKARSLVTGATADSNEGMVVLKPASHLTLLLQQDKLIEGETIAVVLRNRGNVANTYTLSLSSSQGDLRFGLLTKAEAAAPAPEEETAPPPAPARPFTLPSVPKIPTFLRRLPVVGNWLHQMEQSSWIRGWRERRSQIRYAQTLPRQVVGDNSTTSSNPKRWQWPRRAANKRIDFAPTWQEQITVGAGKEERLSWLVQAGKRPFIGNQPVLQPFTVQVIGGHHAQQSRSGTVAVLPRWPIWPLATGLIILLLFFCLFTFSALIVGQNAEEDARATRVAFAQGNDDYDGLTNGQEIELGTDPKNADTDGDGISDSDELTPAATGQPTSNPLDAGDPTLAPTFTPAPTMTPTITPPPTEIPTQTPVSTPSPTPLPPYSEAALDGTLLKVGAGGFRPQSDVSWLMVGDDENNQQIKAILSFNTAVVSSEREIGSITLRLWLDNDQIKGDPFGHLGYLYVDLAPPDGFGSGPSLTGEDFAAEAVALQISSYRNGHENWISINFSSQGQDAIIQAVQNSEVVQLRLYFEVPTDSGGTADYLVFASGEATANEDNDVADRRPYLYIVYR